MEQQCLHIIIKTEVILRLSETNTNEIDYKIGRK